MSKMINKIREINKKIVKRFESKLFGPDNPKKDFLFYGVKTKKFEDGKKAIELLREVAKRNLYFVYHSCKETKVTVKSWFPDTIRYHIFAAYDSKHRGVLMYLYIEEDLIDLTSIFGLSNLENHGTMYFVPCSRNELKNVVATFMEGDRMKEIQFNYHVKKYGRSAAEELEKISKNETIS